VVCVVCVCVVCVVCLCGCVCVCVCGLFVVCVCVVCVRCVSVCGVCVCVFVALVTQHEMRARARRIVLLSVAYPSVQYFPTLSIKRHDCRGKKAIEHKNVCFYVLYIIYHSTKN